MKRPSTLLGRPAVTPRVNAEYRRIAHRRDDVPLMLTGAAVATTVCVIALTAIVAGELAAGLLR